MSLHKYKQKRDFNTTPEPAGSKTNKSNSLRFVVHKHAARNLHYDLRLELDGVLLSWAVPKGPSMNPHDRHLAIRTEDHPIQYLKFKGVIPKGNYGAGKIDIYDSGRYEPRAETKNPTVKLKSELKAGHITFILHGKKLKGEFALIKNEHIGHDAWLLIKKGDKYASGTTKRTIFSELAHSKQSKMPGSITPMLCSLVDAIFDNQNWLFEIKWDGFRAVAYHNHQQTILKSRNNKDLSDRFDPITKAVEKLKHNVVLDGEIVAVDEDGKPHFEWLQNNQSSGQGKLIYYVFDILWCDGADVTAWSLTERRKLLKAIIGRNQTLRISDGIQAQGRALFRQIVNAGMEGVVAKNLDSTYQIGKRGNDWLKIKSRLRQEVVIGGYTEPRGKRKNLGAILVGYYINGKLHYCGHVGTGFSDEALVKLQARLSKIERKKCPFINDVIANDIVHWVKPTLICEVEYQEITNNGTMRQPSFLGLRSDKATKDVVLESPKHIGPAPVKRSGMVQLTHLGKIFWPKLGITKGDLLDYYRGVAPLLLKYLKDRPESLLRQPDGITGEGFFQKDISTIAPRWAKTFTEHSDTSKRNVTYLITNNIRSLEFMVQLGVIEINPWNSRTKKPDHPDWIVIDLDPEGVSFETVIEVAQAVKAVCDELKIPAYPKTSGKTGIHIYIPMGAKYTYSQGRQFAEILANIIHSKVPKLTSIERNPKKRPHKVYIDFLQNHQGQTLAAPYCARPSAFAGVSTPLEWKEVKPGLKPEDFTIKNALARFKKTGDLFAPVLGKGIDLKTTLKLAEPMIVKIDSQAK